MCGGRTHSAATPNYFTTTRVFSRCLLNVRARSLGIRPQNHRSHDGAHDGGGRRVKTFDLAGKVAVVTGGAGILGQHFAAGLAEHGATVEVIDIDDAVIKLSESFEKNSLAVSLEFRATLRSRMRSAPRPIE